MAVRHGCFWRARASKIGGKMRHFSHLRNYLIICTTFTPKIISNLF